VDSLMSFLITVYGDESGDKSVYSYSALLGKLIDFVELERRWRRDPKHEADLKNYVPYSGDHPHLLTFRMLFELMAIEVEEIKYKNEPMAFVCDQQREHSDRTLKIYEELSGEERGWPLRHRLGSISFDSRFCKVALQASDTWAYEPRKWVSDQFTNLPERWQVRLFKDSGRFNVQGYEETTVPRLLTRLREEARAQGESDELPPTG
jgi:hypothetical protein